jgi:hypothetical protein
VQWQQTSTFSGRLGRPVASGAYRKRGLDGARSSADSAKVGLLASDTKGPAGGDPHFYRQKDVTDVLTRPGSGC